MGGGFGFSHRMESEARGARREGPLVTSALPGFCHDLDGAWFEARWKWRNLELEPRKAEKPQHSTALVPVINGAASLSQLTALWG